MTEEERIKRNEYMRNWRAANIDRIAPIELEKNRKWRANNPGKQTQMATKWKEANRNKTRAASKKWKDNNEERVKNSNCIFQRNKMYHLGKYKITVDEYNRMELEQNGLCKICGNPETNFRKDGTRKRLSVDHNHKTGKVRALLCHVCNQTLGKVKEDVQYLQAFINYINTYNSFFNQSL